MCQQCEEKPVYKFTNKRKLCARCFLRYFQKKVLYTIRKFKMAEKKDRIFYENKGDLHGIVLEDALKLFSEKSGAKLIKIRTKADKIAVSSALDSEADKIVHEIIRGSMDALKGKSPPVEKIRKKEIIKPLYLLLNEELMLYARLKKLKFKHDKHKLKKDKISEFIGHLEGKHPEVKRAVMNGWLRISKINFLIT